MPKKSNLKSLNNIKGDQKSPFFDIYTMKKWLKRLGLAGFLFFLIKGLIWVGVFAAAYFFGN